MKNKRRHAQAAYRQSKKSRKDTADADVSDVDLGNASSASDSDDDYFKDDQKFQYDDGVEEILPITNEDGEDSDEQKSEDSDSDEDFEHKEDEALEDGSSDSEDEADSEDDMEKTKKESASAVWGRKQLVVQKQSPELIPTVHSFKEKLLDLKGRMLPLVKHLKKTNVLDESKYSKYVLLKTRALMSYCTNASFYMSLKCLNIPVTGHPVLKTLEKYEKILNQLKVLDLKLNPMIDAMLKNVVESDAVCQELSGIFSDKEKVTLTASNKKILKKETVVKNGKDITKSKDKKKVHFDTDVEKEVLSGYMEMREQERKSSNSLDSDPLDDDEMAEERDEEENAEDDNLNMKRSITYQISKNKGLLPYRKKEYRNPRVRHRMKFKKAQIKRKGQVRLPRKEVKKYSGELSGISSHVTKSIKIK